MQPTIYEQLADFLTQHGIDSPYDTDWHQRQTNPGALKIDAVDFAQFGELPSDWKTAVHRVMGERRCEAFRIKVRAAYEQLSNQQVRECLIAMHDAGDQLGMSSPQPVDLSSNMSLTKKSRSGYSPASCGASLKLKDAVRFAVMQNAYDDTSLFAVPVDGEVADLQAAHQNLRQLAASWNTATGIAGDGSTWNAALIADNKVVILSCRSSIAD